MIGSVSTSGLNTTQGLRHSRKANGQGQRPELPDSFKSVFDSAVQENKQNGGSAADLQKTVAAKYEDYKKTDDYKNLSADQKSKLDAFVARGPGGPHGAGGPKGPPPSDASSQATATTSASAADATSTDATDPTTIAQQLMDALAQKGDQTRSRLGLDFAQQTATSEAAIEE